VVGKVRSSVDRKSGKVDIECESGSVCDEGFCLSAFDYMNKLCETNGNATTQDLYVMTLLLLPLPSFP
jgi:hypothetical protein